MSSGFVTKQTDFGDKNHIWDKVYCQTLTNGTNEIDVKDLGTGVKNWTSETEYKANTLVYVGGKLYLCLLDHTAGTDFLTDLTAGNWKYVGTGVGSPTW